MKQKKTRKKPGTFMLGFKNNGLKSNFKSNFKEAPQPKITRSDIEDLCDAMLPELERRARKLYYKELAKNIHRV
jgi:hypothetical protein